MELSNRVRGFSYVARVLAGQQNDPLCSTCKAWVNTANAARESLAAFELEHAEVLHSAPDDLNRLCSDARALLARLNLPADTAGQKKAGNCKLPEGVCFVKSSRALLEKI